MTSNIVTIILMALVTYLTRSAVFILDIKIPNELEKFLKYVPFAILSALIFPSLIIADNKLFLNTNNHHLIAGIITIIIAATFKKPILSVICGMGIILTLKFFAA